MKDQDQAQKITNGEGSAGGDQGKEEKIIQEEKTAQEELLRQCVAYFKENHHLHALLEAAQRKYSRYGKITGILMAHPQSREEWDAIQAFLGGPMEIHGRNVQKALDDSRFAGCNFQEVVEAYFEEPLLSHREKKQIDEAKREAFFEGLCQEQERRMAIDCGQEGAAPRRPWLRFMLEDPGFCRGVYKEYAEDPLRLKAICQELEALVQGVEELGYQQGHHRRLAEFAAQTTGDPHALDPGRVSQKLLLAYLRVRSGEEAEEMEEKEAQADLFYRWGLMGDEVSNHTLCCGLQGMTGEGRIHQGMQGYAQEAQPHHLTIGTLSGLRRVWGKGEDLFIVENPTVFITLARAFRGDVPLVCTNGFLRMASLALLDLCIQEKCTLHYSGDMDPEGLLIADRLKERYKERLVFWRMDEENYRQAVSNVKISSARQKKLAKIKDQQLEKVAMLLLETRRGAYQETLMEGYLEDLQRMLARRP